MSCFKLQIQGYTIPCNRNATTKLGQETSINHQIHKDLIHYQAGNPDIRSCTRHVQLGVAKKSSTAQRTEIEIFWDAVFFIVLSNLVSEHDCRHAQKPDEKVTLKNTSSQDILITNLYYSHQNASLNCRVFMQGILDVMQQQGIEQLCFQYFLYNPVQ